MKLRIWYHERKVKENEYHTANGEAFETLDETIEDDESVDVGHVVKCLEEMWLEFPGYTNLIYGGVEEIPFNYEVYMRNILEWKKRWSGK